MKKEIIILTLFKLPSAFINHHHLCSQFFLLLPVLLMWQSSFCPLEDIKGHQEFFCRAEPVFSLYPVILCHVQTGSSCGRTARCWSLRRTPPRRAVGGSGWNRGGGGLGDAGHRNLSCWQPVWTRLEDAEQDGQDRKNRQTWAWLFLYWKMFMTFQLIQSNEAKCWWCFGGNSAFACKTK